LENADAPSVLLNDFGEFDTADQSIEDITE